MAEILVGGDDQHLLDPLVGVGKGGRGPERVVGLELDHRPHHEPRRFEGPLDHRDLLEDLRIHALTRLVARPHVVAEALDHVVGGDADVCRAVLHQHQGRADHAGGRRIRMSVAVPRRRTEVLAEQLVGAVDQMNTHGAQPYDPEHAP